MSASMSASITVASQRSWASIVKGETTPTDTLQPDKASQAISPLQPANRGERTCLCHGEILVLLGYYGWIMALDEIDHPDAGKNGGRIYVNKHDITEDEVPLTAGDRVIFYLYADQQGLGAEGCHLDEPEPASLIDDPEFGPSLSDSFLPQVWHEWDTDVQDFEDPEQIWNLSAEEFTPSDATECFADKSAVHAAPKNASMNPAAAEFMPQSRSPSKAEFTPGDVGMNPHAVEFVPTALASLTPAAPQVQTAFPARTNVEVLAINLAYLSDSSDEEDTAYGDDDASSEVESAAESEDSWEDREASKATNQWDAQLEAVVLSAPLKGDAPAAAKRATSPEGSTSAGSSGSDSDEANERFTVARPLFPAGFKPPPGLDLPAPPGL
mmetsp:Transcript_44854/g.74607  ORF Transcript_44854/g.74607 Transcript_44854/m.74607 type:complete len:383 (+) Transcript_44854:101-1249(+)